MGPIDEQQYIEDYLGGRLSEGQRSEFELRMETDEAFRNSVTTHRSLQDFLSDDQLITFRKKVSIVHAEHTLPKVAPVIKTSSRNLSLKRVMALAASFLLLVFATWWMNQSDIDQLQYPDLALAYSEPYPLPGTARGDLNSKMDLAYTYYNEENYEEAAKVYAKLSAVDTSNAFFQFATGVSELLNDQPERAIPLLQLVVNSKALLFHQQARWYLALAFLRLDSSNEAILQLEQINPGHYQYDRAQELLKKLNRN